MKSESFCYWLQGFLEINDAGGLPTALTQNQVNVIQKHLALVFKHEIDPSMGDQKHQEELNEIHSKPTLQELGEKHNFQVTDSKFGPCPGEGYKLSTLHGWYKESEGTPRC